MIYYLVRRPVVFWTAVFFSLILVIIVTMAPGPRTRGMKNEEEKHLQAMLANIREAHRSWQHRLDTYRKVHQDILALRETILEDSEKKTKLRDTQEELKLLGIICLKDLDTGEECTAIFPDKEEVKKGGRIGNYRVLQITQEKVVLIDALKRIIILHVRNPVEEEGKKREQGHE